jgi:hypothetical protein
MDMLPVKFEFRGAGYEALIRVKVKETKTEYYITIMNGELEKMLFGHHILIEENGLLLQGSAPDDDIRQLKQTIAEALKHYLALVPVAGHG